MMIGLFSSVCWRSADKNETAVKRKSERKLSARGGRREGPGRPSIGVRKVRLTLADHTIDKGRNIGEGNLSRGVRIAVKDYRKKPGRKEPCGIKDSKTCYWRHRQGQPAWVSRASSFLERDAFLGGNRACRYPENRRLLEAAALVISTEIKNKTFDYVKHFPKGNKAHLFKAADESTPSHITVEAYYKVWIKKQEGRGRPHRAKDYQTINRHVLKPALGSRPSARSRSDFSTCHTCRPCRVSLKQKGSRPTA